MRRNFIAGCALFAASATLAQQVVVRKGGDGKIGISFAQFRSGSDSASQTFLSVLKADLNRSGYFTVTSQGAEIAVVGQVAGNASQMKAEVSVYKASNRQRMMGKSYSPAANLARKLAHQVADEILLAVTGKPGMAQAKLAVVGTRTGRKELYVFDIDGGNGQQITKDNSIVVGPKWTPDGKNITYTSHKAGYPNVYMTGQGRPVSNYKGLNSGGMVSPDGSSMAVILSRDGNPELYIKSLRSGQLQRLTRTKKVEASPCWSPDGNYLVYVSDETGRPHIYIISRNGGTPKRLSSSGTENVAPDWGKNGLITYCSRVGGKYRVVVADPRARTQRVLDTDWADYEDPCWAPDGRHIVCSRTASYRSAIYLLDTLKDSPVALISGSGDWYSPACSP